MLFTILTGLVASLAAPVQSVGQPAAPDSGLQLRVNGDVVIAPDTREGGVVVVKGNATVEGRVGFLVVIDGIARIAGGRVGDLTVVRGRAELTDGAIVERDAHLLEAELSMADSARVVGTIERGAGRRLARDFVGLAALFGIGVLAALVLGGVLAAAIAPRLLRSTGRLMDTTVGRTAGAALLVWAALPFAAMLLVPTVVGAPAGLGVFIFILPVAWYLGLIVAGTWLGDQVLGRLRGRVEATRPYLAAAAGITALLFIGRLAFVATAMGGGALALACWRSVTARAGTAP